MVRGGEDEAGCDPGEGRDGCGEDAAKGVFSLETSGRQEGPERGSLVDAHCRKDRPAWRAAQVVEVLGA